MYVLRQPPSLMYPQGNMQSTESKSRRFAAVGHVGVLLLVLVRIAPGLTLTLSANTASLSQPTRFVSSATPISGP